MNNLREFWESTLHSLNKNRLLWKWSIRRKRQFLRIKNNKTTKGNNMETRTSVEELDYEMDVAEKQIRVLEFST